MDIPERVELILRNWCLPEAIETALPIPVSDDAYGFWYERYKPRFTRAMEGGRTWEGDGQNVLERTRKIGARAAELAVEHGLLKVGVAEAEQASNELDCDTKDTRHIWCPP